MSRSCARPGCSQAAVATLSYAYSESAVWLEELAVEAHPMTHDLCLLHSDAVKVPRGWDLNDVRNRPAGGGSADLPLGASTAGSQPVHSDRDSNGAALRLVGA
ncbi:MAG: DUF3499 domain-containing protein [Microthrixaceae bacterium]|nr:DUF3499 domain-containing protein [Microthrixaceae bacterium]